MYTKTCQQHEKCVQAHTRQLIEHRLKHTVKLVAVQKRMVLNQGDIYHRFDCGYNMQYMAIIMRNCSGLSFISPISSQTAKGIDELGLFYTQE